MKSRATVLFGLLTLLSIALVFSSTLFKGEPISRFVLLNQLDVLMNPSLRGGAITVAQDPSACLQSIPKEIFAHDRIIHGQTPLWNPLSGCGTPLIADPANTLWSPIDLLFSPADQFTYNIGLVVRILLGGVFSYLFFVRSGAKPWAAAVAAIGYALCARVLRTVELATGFEILPAVFLIFRLLEPDAGFKKIGLCAIGLALCYTALHPEVYFVTMLSAVFLWFTWEPRLRAGSLAAQPSSSPGGFEFKNVIRQFLTLAKLAVMTLLLVSPFLLSFLEYLKYAHSYKYEGSSIEYIPLAQLPWYIFIPRIAGTLFPGWVVLFGLPAGIFSTLRSGWSVFLIIVFWILFSCRPAPFDTIFAQAPFSYLLPEYALGTIMLLICSVAAIGLSNLRSFGKNLVSRIIVGILSILAVMIPLLCLFKSGVPSGLQVDMSSKVITLAAISIVGSALLLLLCPYFNSDSDEEKDCGEAQSKKCSLARKISVILPIALVMINLASMVRPARSELPVTFRVPTPPEQRKEFFQQLKAIPHNRITACGAGLLPPCSNLIYGEADLRTCSPLNIVRYLKFMNRLGAKLGYCNMMEVPSRLNHLIDVAAVDLLISSAPLRSAESEENNAADEKRSDSPKRSDAPVGRIMPGLRLMESECAYNPGAAEIDVTMKLRVHDSLRGRYHAQLIMRDDQNKDIWRGDIQALATGNDSQSQHLQTLSWLAPAPLQGTKEVKLLFLLRDAWTNEFIKADGIALSSRVTSDSELLLAKCVLQAPEKITTADGHFSLVYETQDLLRIYRNLKAQPRLYLLHKVVAAESDDAALDKIADPKFSAATEAVLETEGGSMPQVELSAEPNKEEIAIPVTNTDSSIEMGVKCNAPGVLVFADTFYPGWHADVDGHPVKIYHCNYLFRAIPIATKGYHWVSFRYMPSFNLGFIVCFFTVFSVLFSFWKQRTSSKLPMENH